VLHLRNVTHRYGTREVLRDINLSVTPGQVLALTGPSGCGKTTLLHLVAGLRAPSAGQVDNRFGGSAYVFQDPRLLPWQTALDNLAFGLKAQGVPKRERRERARTLSAQLGLEGTLDRYPYQLSGGMRQRVALGRALLLEPELLLLDEPFSDLDIGLKRELQGLLQRLLEKHGIAAIFVSHDLSEAVGSADQLVVMAPSPGRVVYRQTLPGRRGQRHEAEVHALVAKLLSRPEVSTAFGLPPSQLLFVSQTLERSG
jgi:NitT/TauT family transport system ATP-binding protein